MNENEKELENLNLEELAGASGGIDVVPPGGKIIRCPECGSARISFLGYCQFACQNCFAKFTIDPDNYQPDQK